MLPPFLVEILNVLLLEAKSRQLLVLLLRAMTPLRSCIAMSAAPRTPPHETADTTSFPGSVSKVCIDVERILVTVSDSEESVPIQTALSELGTVTPEVGVGIPVAPKKKAKLTFATGSGGETPMCEPTASQDATASA